MMDRDLAWFVAAEPKGSPRQQEADRRLAALVARRRARHRRQRGGEAAACLGDAIVAIDLGPEHVGRAGRLVARAVECLEDLDVDGATRVSDMCVELQDAIGAQPAQTCVEMAMRSLEALLGLDVKGGVGR